MEFQASGLNKFEFVAANHLDVDSGTSARMLFFLVSQGSHDSLVLLLIPGTRSLLTFPGKCVADAASFLIAKDSIHVSLF